MSRTQELMLEASMLRGPMDAGLHCLWSQAKDQNDYDKQWWQARQRELERSYPSRSPAMTDPAHRLNLASDYGAVSMDVMAFLERIHGVTPHRSDPNTTEKESRPDPQRKALRLRTQLKESIEQENYEFAAILRDQIQQLMRRIVHDTAANYQKPIDP
ncbi:MAG: UvrB/UvrC motif-containing protein [Planctomycetota bacterium]|nr:UvrB/UvrC motif-containing protein [Planctomycetota bacterium]